jgi:hypothetical protein
VSCHVVNFLRIVSDMGLWLVTPVNDVVSYMLCLMEWTFCGTWHDHLLLTDYVKLCKLGFFYFLKPQVNKHVVIFVLKNFIWKAFVLWYVFCMKWLAQSLVFASLVILKAELRILLGSTLMSILEYIGIFIFWFLILDLFVMVFTVN